MILRARAVVTMVGAPIENGAVAIRGNQIVDVGDWAEVRRRNGGEVIDLGERVLLPGLINAHCHLDYTDLRGKIAPPSSSFADWIGAINERKAGWTAADYVRSIKHGFAEAEKFGTTTLLNFEAFPELIGRLLPAPLRTWWLAEMIDVRKSVSAEEVFRKLRDAAQADELSEIGLAPHAPYTASRSLYAEFATIGARNNLLLATHLAESDDERRMFREADGPLYDFMRQIGRPMDDCGRATPLANFLEQDLGRAHWLVIHLNELTPDDLVRLESGPRFSVVHCPRSHAFFGHAPFQLSALRGLGYNICLGTDSLASNDDLSLFAEMRQLAKLEPALPARELLAMVTINPAAALGRATRLGRVAAGAFADLIALPFGEKLQSIYEKIVMFEGAESWWMMDGRVRENA